MAALIACYLMMILTGCGHEQVDPPSQTQPISAQANSPIPTGASRLIAMAQSGSSCNVSVPTPDLSVPQWVGQRTDEPFDIRAYLVNWQQKYDPVAECLYLTGLADLTNDMANCVSEEFREEQRIRQTNNFARIWELAPNDPAKAGAWDEGKARQLLQELRPALAVIEKAQQQPSCVFSTSLNFGQTFPHLQAMRVLASVGQIEFRLVIPSGDFAQIEHLMQRSLRITRDVRPRGMLIQQLIGYAVDAILFEIILKDILNHPGLTADECQRLYRILDEHEAAAIDPLVEAMRAEYIMMGNTLRGLEQGTIQFKDVEMEGISPRVAQTIDYDMERAALNGLYAFVLDELVKEPYASFLKHNRYLDRVTQMKTEATSDLAPSLLVNGKLPHSILVVLLAPAFDQFREALSRRETRLGAIKCLLMVRRFELMHKRLPSTLGEAFQDAGVNKVPDDPYSGEKLKYRIINNDIRVYSVGKDQKDDLAEQDWDFGRQPGDFILQMPALSR